MPFGSGSGGLPLTGGTITPSATTALEIVSPPLNSDFAVDKFGSVLIQSDIATQHTLSDIAVTRPTVISRILQIASGLAQTEAGGFDRDGYFFTHKNAAPADADVGSSELFLWFDDTNGVGNTKLMLKGRSADGTLKTATIVLA